MNSPKKLYRSKKDVWIAGVCGGLGEYLGVDTMTIRILWLIFTVLGGSGILIYLLCWLLIPVEPVEPIVSTAPAAPKLNEAAKIKSK
jgi:phage shock protein C